MPQANCDLAPHGHISNGHAATRYASPQRTDGRRTIDWSGYPSLFQRVTPSGARRTPPEGREAAAAPKFVETPDVRDAFLGYCQAAFHAPAEQNLFGAAGDFSAGARALAAAESYGFTRDEIRRLGCGMYPNPTAVEEHLRAVGFAASEIDAACLARDTSGRLRSELGGCLVVPLTDEAGRLSDFLLLTAGESGRSFNGYRFLYGPSKTKAAAYGIQLALSQSARQEPLIIVDDVLECLLLQCRGLERICALGPVGEDFSPWRWEEFARLGVKTVTLAFRRDERHRTAIRDALVGALRARTAPEVLVANPYPGEARSAADVLRRFGKDTCAVALASCSLAFHDKDFGAAAQSRPEIEEEVRSERARPRRVEAPTEPYHREAYRRHLAELSAALPPADRSFAEQTIAAVDAAIVVGAFNRATSIVEWSAWEQHRDWPARDGQGRDGQPSSWPPPHPIENPHQSASVASAAAVLERLVKSQQTTEVPAYLAGYAGREEASSVEWLIDAEPRSRAATLCERLIDACERRPNQAFVVACCEHSAQQLVLALTTCLAARLSEGAGLTVEEVRTRLSGSEPAEGYRDKPWLVDEAADRLRLWSSRLTFVTCPVGAAGRAAVEQAVETARARMPVGGIYFDGLPGSDWTGVANWHDAAWLKDLAARCGSSIVAATSTSPIEPTHACPTGPWQPASSASWSLSRTSNGKTLLCVLRDWIRRECA